ncbi:WG repeat-containing protein [Polaromonas naphthalenivorans]
MGYPTRFEDARAFQAGKAAVKHNGKWGFINKRGDWL